MSGGCVLYVDAIGGAAGDMLLAALLDAGAPLEVVREAMGAVLPGRYTIEPAEVRRGGIRATQLRIEPLAPGETPTPRPFGDLMASLERAPLPEPVASRAKAILDRLGQAEARVHGIGLDELMLHELGDDDTLLDVVGVSAALASLEVELVLVSPLPIGPGALRAEQHRGMPAPAPVTLELLRGFVIRPTVPGEWVTPTAAAILATLGHPSSTMPVETIDAVGYGAGTDDPPDWPNLVRVVVGTLRTVQALGTSAGRDLVVLEANVDDLTAELMADAVQALFAAGALDAWTTPIQMKKGRPAVLLSALGEPAAEARLRRVMFESTTTFGVRSHAVRRAELVREVSRVALADGAIRVKVGYLDGRVVTVTPEHDDVAALAERTGRSIRDVYEEAVAAARALRFESSER